jgi:pimeloyl-ACP methyl ester carboxylesterase
VYGAAATAFLLSLSAIRAGANDIASSDLFVPHISTLAANAGELIALHVHRKVATLPTCQVNAIDRVVLFVHGATVPSVPAFGLDYKGYDWLGFLARAGFDVWAMDLTGYGASARPLMDDPCNVSTQDQQLILNRPLPQQCAPHFELMFKTVRNDWDEIDSVVEHIRRATGGSERLSCDR